MNYRLNLLLIDDDLLDAEAISRQLTKTDPNHHLVVAHDGEVALSILRSQEIQTPFIVLLDLLMPKLDGYALLDILRNDPLLRTTPVFVITTVDSTVSKSNLYHRGIAGYLLKNQLGEEFENLIGFLTAYHRIIEYPLRS